MEIDSHKLGFYLPLKQAVVQILKPQMSRFLLTGLLLNRTCLCIQIQYYLNLGSVHDRVTILAMGIKSSILCHKFELA